MTFANTSTLNRELFFCSLVDFFGDVQENESMTSLFCRSINNIHANILAQMAIELEEIIDEKHRNELSSDTRERLAFLAEKFYRLKNK